MRLDDLRLESGGGWSRAAARVIWEDCDRPTTDLYFACPTDVADGLAPDPHAFLLASVMPAGDAGERRVRVPGAICPELHHNLEVAFRVIAGWFPTFRKVAVEPTEGFRATRAPLPPRVGSFLSGGIDGLATLRSNRLDFSLDHPASIREAFFLFGFNTNDFEAGTPVTERVQDFERRRAIMAELARAADFRLVPVHTNIRFLARDFEAWNKRGMGAGLAAVAHAFGARLTRALIASGSGLSPDPLGTHHALDPYYSRAGLEVRHDGLWLSRLEKTALVAEWPAARPVVHVCQQHQLMAGTPNCGRCNKCRRTMIQLAALGQLEAVPVFPASEVTVETIRTTPVNHAQDATFLEECLEPLERSGRTDLAHAIRARLEQYRRHQAWLAPPGWKRRLRRLLGRC